jgi:hypothetical protein
MPDFRTFQNNSTASERLSGGRGTKLMREIEATKQKKAKPEK